MLERLKAAAAAAQARVTVGFDASQRAAQRAAGLPERRVGAGIAAQVGLARRDSPVRGARHLGLARALVGELPHTLAALSAGETSEWRATLIARETACLSRADRARVDAELAARPGGIGALGDREAAAEARRIGYRLDPHALTAGPPGRTASGGSRCGPPRTPWPACPGCCPRSRASRSTPPCTRHADTLRSHGDARSRGQIMADTLVERVTGQTTATAVPVEVHLVMTDTTLLGTGTDRRHTDAEAVDVPAHLEGYGPCRRRGCGDWLRDTDAAGVAASALRQPGDRAAGRDGLPTPPVHRTAPPVRGPARPALPHPLVQRPDPTRRPPPTRARTADPPAPRTPKASARPATTPRKPPAGPPDHHQPRSGSSQRPGPRCRDHHPHRTPPPHPTPLPPGPTRPPRTTRPRLSRAEISFRRDLHVVLAC